MDHEQIVLQHFGEQCAPKIIINEILHYGHRSLFHLGFYNFNDILEYLKRDKFHEIYDVNYLYTMDGKKLNVHPTISEQKYFHPYQVMHSLYKFAIYYHYGLNDLSITNNAFIIRTFKEKIDSFEKAIDNKTNFMFFITFVRENTPPPKVDEMIKVLLKKKSNFKILFFTDSPAKAAELKNAWYTKYYHVILLNQKYNNWHLMEPKIQYSLYKEIYDKFYQSDPLIKSHFPTFEQTPYALNYNKPKP
jgi:hypothetical protein